MPVVNANYTDPDQTPRSAASNLGVHYLALALLGVSRLKWIKLVQVVATVSGILLYKMSRFG